MQLFLEISIFIETFTDTSMYTSAFVKRFLWLAGALFTVFSFLSFTACHTSTSSGQDDTRTFSVRDFDRVDVGSAMEINIRQGGNFSVMASGRKSDLDDLEASVSGGKLRVRYRESRWNSNRKRVTLDIVMPQLRGADFSGASRSTISGFRNQGTFDLEISGASTSTVGVDATRLNLDVSGASNVTLTGKAETLAGEVSGASSVKAYELSLKDASLEVSGASSARINVTGKLNVSASGASSVRYRGGAAVRSNTSGASSVHTES
ncbi:head GIN domain-containing protein [Nibrella viscosa]|uniref:head GIN domain-containing protein n=1 Tax=Nibrella viscosa TaxID=1084524 RepID=UPI0031F011AE